MLHLYNRNQYIFCIGGLTKYSNALQLFWYTIPRRAKAPKVICVQARGLTPPINSCMDDWLHSGATYFSRFFIAVPHKFWRYVQYVQWWAWAISAAAAACLLFLRDPGPRSRLRWCFWLERPPYWEEHISLLIITLVQGTNFDLQAPNQSIGTRDNQLWSSIMDHQHD